MLRTTRITALAALAAVILVAGCGEEPLTLPAPPNAQITDGAHNNGNQRFFFLPPLVPAPQATGVFDGSQAPVVQICVWTANACAGTVAEFTTTGGSGSETVRVDQADEQYIVNWHTDDFNLDPTVTYRIRVLVAGADLGHADVDVVSSGKELKNVNTGEFIALLDGRTLPIKFRIEQGAVFLIGNDGGVVTSTDGNVNILIPPGTVSGSTGFTVQPATVPAGEFGPAGLVPGTAYDFGPSGSTFTAPGVTLSVKYDPANLGATPESDLTLVTLIDGKWAQVPNATVSTVNHTVTADVQHFSVYVVAGSMLGDITEPFVTLVVGGPAQTMSYTIGSASRFIGWSSTTPSVATVDPVTGIVTPVAAGATRIRLTSYDPYYGGWTDEIFVNVLATPPLAGQLTWYKQREGITANDLYAVHGTSASDVFLVGRGGTILHWDGANATQMNSGMTRTIRGVWARAPNDVFAAGPGAPGTGSAVIHYNGSAWSFIDVRPEFFRTISGNSTYLFVAADNKVVRYQGSAAGPALDFSTLSPNGTVISVAAEGSSVIAAGEENGVGMVYISNADGAPGTWTAGFTPTNYFGQPASGPITALWRDPNAAGVGAVTIDGRMEISGNDGVTWPVNEQLTNVVFRSVTSKPKPAYVFAKSPDIFAGGEYGELDWSERCRCGFGASGFRADQYVKQDIWGMWTDNLGLAWGVGTAGLIFRQTSSSSHSFDVLTRGQPYADIWVHASGRVVAPAGAIHNQVWTTGSYGAQWAEPSLLRGGAGFQGAFGAADGTEAYVVGLNGAIARGTPSSGGYFFTNLNSGTTQPLYDVWVSPSGPGSVRPVYASGGAGTLLRSADHGASWVSRGSPLFGTQDMLQIYGRSDNEVVVGTAVGSIYRTTDGGLTWSQIRAGAGEGIFGLWSASSNEIYASGREVVGGVSRGVIIHSHNAASPGATWFKDPYPGTRYLSGAWGDGAGMLVVVGAAGTVWVNVGHVAGSEPLTWTTQNLPTPVVAPKDLFAVYGAVDPNTGQRVVFAAGTAGTIYTGVTP